MADQGATARASLRASPRCEAGVRLQEASGEARASGIWRARTTPVALRMRDRLSLDDWLLIGGQISRLSSSSAWWLGDWLLYGERTHRGRYRAAVERSGLEYQTLRNYAWVARMFPVSRRRDTLSFQHHVEVAALGEAEQELWLNRAEQLRWSRNELRRQLAAARAPADGGGRPVLVRLQVAPEREQRWREAAEAARQPLGDWLAAVADQAACGAARA